MSSFLKSAKAVYDVDSDLDYVAITYERFVKGKGYATYVDYIHTKPSADWVYLKSKTQSIPYEKFLDTMCEKTMEVHQKMAELALQNIISDKQNIIHTFVQHTLLRFWTPAFNHLGLILKVLGRGNLLKSFVWIHLLISFNDVKMNQG